VTGADGGGNPFLDPWKTDNIDLSAEYYLGNATMFYVGLFKLDIESFTAGGTRRGEFPDSDGVIRREVDVTTTILGEGGTIEGAELGAKFDFSDFTDGFFRDFGLDVNYTYAPSDSNETDLIGNAIPFTDNSERSYNVVGWFQSEKWQARLAYNYRSERYTGRGADIPQFQDEAAYLDAQVTYDATDNVSIYVNGSNITGEVEDYFYDFGNGPKQYWQQNEFEARYTIGVRARF
jgi:TonB-dependent receptor